MTPAQVAVSDPWDRLLAAMLRARRFDEALIDEAGLITGVFHVSIGRERPPRSPRPLPGDLIMLGHRNHGDLAAMGSDFELMFREFLGRDGGPQRGRAGSLHLADPSGRPLHQCDGGGRGRARRGDGVGQERRRAPGIVVACFGDGAMSEGTIYEALTHWRLGESRALRLREQSPAAAGALTPLSEAHGIAIAVDAGRRPKTRWPLPRRPVREDRGP